MRPLLLGLFSLCLLTQFAVAQDRASSLFELKNEPALQGFSSAKPEVSAVLVPTGRPGEVQLQVKLVLPSGGNSYSMDPSFAKPTKITLEETGWKAVDGSYGINPPPKKEHDEIFDQVVEKLFGTVIFSRRFTIPAGTSLSSATLSGKIDFLYCDKESCIPKNAPFKATVVAPRRDEVESEVFPPEVSSSESPASETSVSITEDSSSPMKFGYELVPQKGGANGPVRLQFELSPSSAQPGEKVTAAITLILADNWSTYGLEKFDQTQIETPTTIDFIPTNLTAAGATVSVPSPVVHITRLPNGDRRSNTHTGRVTWKKEFEVAANGPYGVSGAIRYQVCEKDNSCLPPRTVEFQLGSAQQELIAGATPIVTSYLNSGPDEPAPFVVESAGQETTLWSAMGTAFLAGFLMNIMPCVLPVLAIKILSFVQQAGEKRSRILALNLAYTFGVMAVFMVFAFLSVILGQSMGAVFQNTPFMISMACVVFVMGLSLFGVFELPVPGIIPSAGHHQEGYLGAINTGIIATVLGTPCIAPFVATVFTWGLSQPPAIVFAMFGLMGLGMAFPFLLTGIFPALVNWLPRPGNWMVKFKQFTGFIMMGTVIWLLFNVEMEWRVPVLLILLGLALFVWLCANLTSPASGFMKRLGGCIVGAVIALPVVGSGLWLMKEFQPTELGQAVIAAESPEESHHRMPWEPFDSEQLMRLRSEGRPILIDFTANWCVICKINEKIALDREETIEFVKTHGIVPMMADFTKENPEILKYLRMFGQDSVPLTVIIPPGKESKVVAIRGQYTKSILMEKLREAIGSNTGQDANEPASTVSTMGAAPVAPTR
ncbi:MAG TPA: cytochrome c biogenesis protein CcdA [Planctomicrobium sp.]|nr:cytochrome c biogenesis protein CcdA [Planctomicrobium sp.]